ncbi:ENDOSULFINE [Salix purpurea]|uniref:ENDOSULFINE n=1 Tax=Salix purpurea TaxID=77065 RepID=A0A9Q0ZHL0_SALPP|nr:ENDOSULFINE [Salix purpurea]
MFAYDDNCYTVVVGSGMEDGNKQEQVDGNLSEDKSYMPSSKQEDEAVKKKYGGIMPKKPPLISKDHERAFFDSADWALGKQGAEKPKGPLEALRPKLQVESWRMSLEVFSKGLLDKLQLALNESGNYLTMLRGMS